MSIAVPFPVPAVPVCVAPMAGGPSTPELVAAVGDAGGLGFLAGAYRSPQELAEQIARTAELSPAPFGVNIFIPEAASHTSRARGVANDDQRGSRRAEEMAAAAYRELLAEEARRLQARLPTPDWSDTDSYDDKLSLLEVSHDVSVVSFTFGCPTPHIISRLHAAGRCVAVTVTTLDEARGSVEAGADTLIVQGFDAGGHRGTHRVSDIPNELDHLALLPMLTDLGVPLVAAGGITTSGDTRRAIAAGACAVQAGTAFLLTQEAGTSAAQRMALSNPTWGSTVTRAFSGRPARGLRNGFVDRFDAFAPALFPVVDQMTKPLRAAATRHGELDGLSVWAGSGWRAAREGRAADVLARLIP